MFWKKDEKLETLKDLVGSRAAYIETVKMLELEGEEKDIFLRASIEVKKNKPDQEIIDKAYAILIGKSYQGGDATEEISSPEDELTQVDDSLVLETVKEVIGTSTQFMEFINKYNPKQEERAILSGAHQSLKKKIHDKDRIFAAYQVIHKYAKIQNNNADKHIKISQDEKSNFSIPTIETSDKISIKQVFRYMVIYAVLLIVIFLPLIGEWGNMGSSYDRGMSYATKLGYSYEDAQVLADIYSTTYANAPSNRLVKYASGYREKIVILLFVFYNIVFYFYIKSKKKIPYYYIQNIKSGYIYKWVVNTYKNIRINILLLFSLLAFLINTASISINSIYILFWYYFIIVSVFLPFILQLSRVGYTTNWKQFIPTKEIVIKSAQVALIVSSIYFFTTVKTLSPDMGTILVFIFLYPISIMLIKLNTSTPLLLEIKNYFKYDGYWSHAMQKDYFLLTLTVFTTMFFLIQIDDMLPNSNYLSFVISSFLLSVMVFALSEYLKSTKSLMEYHKTGEVSKEDIQTEKSSMVDSDTTAIKNHINEEFIFCVNCGEKMSNKNKFCPKCGTKVS